MPLPKTTKIVCKQCRKPIKPGTTCPYCGKGGSAVIRDESVPVSPIDYGSDVFKSSEPVTVHHAPSAPAHDAGAFDSGSSGSSDSGFGGGGASGDFGGGDCGGGSCD